jgi:hypothetical protein
MCGNLPVFRSNCFTNLRYTLCINKYAWSLRFARRSCQRNKRQVFDKIQGNALKNWKIKNG